MLLLIVYYFNIFLSFNFVGVILSQLIHLSLDAMGGDNSPQKIILLYQKCPLRLIRLKGLFAYAKNYFSAQAYELISRPTEISEIIGLVQAIIYSLL